MREEFASIVRPASPLALELSMTKRCHRFMWLAVWVFGVVAGCAAPQPQPSLMEPMGSIQPKIELLGLPGCPDTPVMRANLAAAIDRIGKRWTFVYISQEKLPEGDLRRGYPTPTILVHNRDLFGLPEPTVPAMACRMYAGGVPDARAIATKLSAATAK